MLAGKIVIITDKGVVGFPSTSAKDYDDLLRKTLNLIREFHKGHNFMAARFEHTLIDEHNNIKGFESRNLTDDINILLDLKDLI